MSTTAASRDAARAAEEKQASRLSRRVTIATVASIVAITGSLVGLVFDFRPGWRPDPQTKLDATMNVIASEGGVMQRAYLKRMGQPTAGAQPVWGYVFYVRMQSEGLKHRKSVLQWFLYNRATGERIQGYGSAETRSSTPSDTFVVPIWVQPPPDPAKKGYFVRFELYTKDTLLAIADSPSFANCTQSGCGAPGG